MVFYVRRRKHNALWLNLNRFWYSFIVYAILWYRVKGEIRFEEYLDVAWWHRGHISATSSLKRYIVTELSSNAILRFFKYLYVNLIHLSIIFHNKNFRVFRPISLGRKTPTIHLSTNRTWIDFPNPQTHYSTLCSTHADSLRIFMHMFVALAFQ